MTKQTINLLGGLLVVVIVLAGVLLGVLPRLNQAGQSHRERDAVAMRNQTQQTLIAAYAQQRAQLPALRAEVAVLKQQIANGPHLEQLIDVASDLPAGAVLRSITPGESAAGAAASGSAGSTSGAAEAAPQSTGTGGFEALPVSVVVSLHKPADAPAVLDKLRAGPRLFAIDHVTLASSGADGKGGGSTLTVDGRVFMTEAAQ